MVTLIGFETFDKLYDVFFESLSYAMKASYSRSWPIQ